MIATAFAKETTSPTPTSESSQITRLTSTLSIMLQPPVRIFLTILAIVFVSEVAVMLLLPLISRDGQDSTLIAFLDGILLSLMCAPVFWWVLIRPLRQIAIEEHLRSQTIVANASDGILTCNHVGEILSCNRATALFFNCNLDKLVSTDVKNLFQDIQFPPDVSQLTSRTKSLHDGEPGASVEISFSQFPTATMSKWIVIFRDLTETEKAEEQRVLLARETEALRTQQMATLAQLATGVAHEIRNPLTSIKMLIQINLDAFKERGLPTQDIELVEQEIRRMERSVTSLLDFARPESPNQKATSITRVIDNTIKLVSPQLSHSQIQLEVQTSESIPSLLLDDAQIQQVLINLMLNAIDAMPNGGKLDLAIRFDETQIFITVRDSGKGIPNEILGRLFTPFTTTKPTGVGLGLSVCKRIAGEHGGTLTARNIFPHGAEFTLTLPIVRNQQSCLLN